MHFLQFQTIDTITADQRLVTFLILLNIILITVIVIYFISRILIPWISKRVENIKQESEIKSDQPETSDLQADDADKAAIAAALYLYFNEMHDEESDIITVKRVSKTYSPWSSKLYSMRNLH